MATHLAALASVVLLGCPSALAQSPSLEVIPSDVEHRSDGTLHLATGAWTPPGSESSRVGVFGVIYNNTCAKGSLLATCYDGTVLLDDGRIPSPTSPAPHVGTRKSYRVVQFEIDYCTHELDILGGGAGATVQVRFFDDWDGCPQTLLGAGTPSASFTIFGLPASPVAGQLSCHTVAINLAGGNEFCLRADADGTYNGGGPADGFGYALSMVNQQGPPGGFTTVRYTACTPGSGTFYMPPENVAGSGLDDDIDWYREGAGGQRSGCSAPDFRLDGFHMKIWADLSVCDVCPDAGDPDADGDGTPDCSDGCPGDPGKVLPGECGCGVADTHSDSDGIPDCNDNCDTIANPGQEDCDHDGEGDACAIAGGDPDCNGNTRPDACDILSGSSLDRNGNGVPDECDNNVHFCFGDGTDGPCPCNNRGGVARGCENSSSTGGAQLTTLGAPSLSIDTLQLVSSGERSTAFTVFLQGDGQSGPLNFGDGLRCFAGNLKRLYAKAAAGGVVTAPESGDPSISVRSAALGDPIAIGGIRYYSAYYRDPVTTFCPDPAGSAFNSSSARKITWGP